jgi:hypothetical protein
MQSCMMFPDRLFKGEEVNLPVAKVKKIAKDLERIVK